MLIDNIRQLQSIIENGSDEMYIINQIIAELESRLKIDIIIADRKGNNLLNTQFKSEDYFYKIPLMSMSKRIGMLYINGIDKLSQSNLEYFYSTIPIFTLTLKNIVTKRDSNIKRQISSVKIVLGSLTQNEVKALKCVFKELLPAGGVVVVSNISKKYNITRSIIVNALKKIESAGIIDSYSLGMKGTNIRVLNKYFYSELNDF